MVPVPVGTGGFARLFCFAYPKPEKIASMFCKSTGSRAKGATYFSNGQFNQELASVPNMNKSMDGPGRESIATLDNEP